MYFLGTLFYINVSEFLESQNEFRFEAGVVVFPPSQLSRKFVEPSKRETETSSEPRMSDFVGEGVGPDWQNHEALAREIYKIVKISLRDRSESGASPDRSEIILSELLPKTEIVVIDEPDDGGGARGLGGGGGYPQDETETMKEGDRRGRGGPRVFDALGVLAAVCLCT